VSVDPKDHNPVKKAGVILKVGDDLKAKFFKKVQPK
jgi:branched-chain amino acid transport system substrate-binding protein